MIATPLTQPDDAMEARSTIEAPQWVPFRLSDGRTRMVRPATAAHAREKLEKQKQSPRRVGGTQWGASYADQAEALLERDHREYEREQRQRANEERRRKEEAELQRARAIEVDLVPVADRAEVKALRTKLEELRSASAGRLNAATERFTAARRAAEEAEEHAARLEAQVALGLVSAEEAEKAAAAAAKAWKEHDDAEAAFKLAEREAARRERTASVLAGELQEAERSAQAELRKDAHTLLASEIEAARKAIDAAAEANGRVFRLELELARRGIQFAFRAHLPGLLSPDVQPQPSVYSEWVKTVENHFAKHQED